MSNRKKLVNPVESQSQYGLYVWILPNGEPFKDDEGNMLNVPSKKYDIFKIKQLADAAAYWGKPEGEARFMPGVGRATEAQAKEDIERMSEGLTPYGDTENWGEIFRNA